MWKLVEKIVLVFILLVIGNVSSLIHDLKISNDDRNIFKIETFGFIAGGKMTFKLTDFSINNYAGTKNRIGFIVRRASSESSSQQDLEQIIDKGSCIFDYANPEDFIINLSNSTGWKETNAIHSVELNSEAGLYSLIFARCDPSGLQQVNFHLQATFVNPGPNYLSAGDTPLPLLYFCFFVLFAAATVVWFCVIFRIFGNNGTVHHIHYMMAALLVVKSLSLLSESIRFHYISLFGSSESWSIIYFIFAGLKGVMLFTVILLIGFGWSLMKPYLNDKEKQIVVVVLTLQVLDNIAMIVLEETAPGSQGWLTWRDILHLIDILCCCAILFPIVSSIRHLRQASEVDGKAHLNLQKLQLFRQFYVMVVIYIYFTRIVVLLLSATIPFYLVWLGDLFTELATLVFYVITGYQFRPTVNNPYLPVQSEESEMTEYGLDSMDDDVIDNPVVHGAAASQL